MFYGTSFAMGPSGSFPSTASSVQGADVSGGCALKPHRRNRTTIYFLMPSLPNDFRVQQLGLGTFQHSDHLSAYNVCLKCEHNFASNPDQQRRVRTLGYLLLTCPEDVSTEVRDELSKCIHSCKNEAAIAELGAFFELYFIKPCELPVCHSLSACQPTFGTFLQS